MRPKQVWIPAFSYSLDQAAVRRDAQRAFDAWQGEDRVFFLPGLKEPVRWKEGQAEGSLYPVLAIPAEHFNMADVLHVGGNGYAVGLAPGLRFPRLLADMFDAWMNVDKLGGVALYACPQKIEVIAPFFENGSVRYAPVSIEPEPGPTMEVADISRAESEHIVSFKWPPDGRPLRPISPEVESAEYYGAFSRTEFEDVPILENQRDPSLRSFHCMERWPEPLTMLLPFGGGNDVGFHQALMRDLADRSASSPDRALEEARRWASLYVGECLSPLEKTWLHPNLRELAERKIPTDAIVARAARFGLMDARTVAEAQASEAWRKKMAEPAPAIRVWGPVGLFWACLLERLEAGAAFRVCERCRRVNSGDARKRFCSLRDNPECHRARRASDRRKERGEQERSDQLGRSAPQGT